MALLRPIFLTQDQIAYVDADLWLELNAVKWRASWNPHTQTFYAVRNIPHPSKLGKRIMERLHRRIMGCTFGDGKIVDHINGDTLLNSRANLRLATNSGNGFNSKKSSRNTSGIVGVSWHRSRGKWRVRVGDSDKPGSHIGLAATLEEARIMRDNAIRERGLEEWIRSNPDKPVPEVIEPARMPRWASPSPSPSFHKEE